MSAERDADPVKAARAIVWHHAGQAAVCDSIEPWDHGHVVRASRFPDYWDYNVVRVEEDPAMSTDELVDFAVAALDGLAHVRIDFDDVDSAAEHERELVARGWRATRLVWMLHTEPVPAGEGAPITVEPVPYDDVHELRLTWFAEDMEGTDPGNYHEQAREVAIARGAEVLAVREEGSPIAFAQLEWLGDAAEITQVFVDPEHRGRGRGTAMTRAAIEAASGAGDLWIVADADDRPQELYARLGFRTVARTTEITRLPAA